MLGVLIAAVVAVIGYLSWRTAEQQKKIAELKVKADLFDRRMEVYTEAKDFIGCVMGRDLYS